ncbi:unnamed protein product [Menidia menidia]|uniref:(Atlantic silverside) hypothetical protein n=1 Tax=Menidia menidia TaxID=238744 RepID=A0A8S4AR82_9TELE|nr:unnamed protein product [Menidia menidia]
MAKRPCSERMEWDALLRMCVKRSVPTAQPGPTTEGQLSWLSVGSGSVALLSPSLWICVILATLGSVLAVTLWLVISRQQARSNSSSGDAVPDQQPLQKTEASAKEHPPPSETNGRAEVFHRAAEAPSPCHRLHLGAPKDSRWDDGFTGSRGPSRHSCTGGGGAAPACSPTADHRVPLPATELGGTALVTTKTV